MVHSQQPITDRQTGPSKHRAKERDHGKMASFHNLYLAHVPQHLAPPLEELERILAKVQLLRYRQYTGSTVTTGSTQSVQCSLRKGREELRC